MLVMMTRAEILADVDVQEGVVDEADDGIGDGRDCDEDYDANYRDDDDDENDRDEDDVV